MLCALAGCGERRESEPLSLAVMDPLAAELACACVGGYAQRDYHALGTCLSRRLQRPVTVVFGDTLDKVQRQLADRPPDLIVGKESVVTFDAHACGLELEGLARLTDPSGRTTLTGLFIVKTEDPARTLPELVGRRILFGPSDSDEKHTAAFDALTAAGVPVPADPEIRGACGDGAVEVADATGQPPPVAVISSYALPLLEGCGSIEPGTLRVLAATRPVEFIALFANTRLSDQTRHQVRSVLLGIKEEPHLLKALESRDGFEPWIASDWTDWRGPNRDGQIDRLPDNLPEKPFVLWKRPTTGPGLAGPAATRALVVLPERDPFDAEDVFRCFRAGDGETLWSLSYEAKGGLDYGNSPRATPVLRGDKAYLLGAQGHLHCVSLQDGTVLWKRHLVDDLGGRLPIWGYCSTPLVVDDRIIVNPGGRKASIVALNRHTGEILWRSPGGEAAYGSFILGEFGGRMQIVGHDAESLGGWDPRTGERLWKLTPPLSGDFNVPTPLPVNGRLAVATENNGTRLYAFHRDGVIDPAPVAVNESLAPETTSPVFTLGRLFGCGSHLHCLDPADQLRDVWHSPDPDPGAHAAMIAAGERLLILSHAGELLLLDTSAPETTLLSRCRLFDDNPEVYAHPAISHGRLFVRDDTSLQCLLLE